MAANKQARLKQLVMYPKHLVYPDGEDAKRDVCPEELRASRARYCLSPSPDCDMDMTEAYYGNITVNVPVVASMEKGREVLHLMEHKPEKTQVPLSVSSKEESGRTLTRELQEKENLPVSLHQFDFTPSASESYSHQYSYNGASFSMKGALSFSESDSLVSSICQSEEEVKMLKEKTILKQERHSDQIHQSLQYVHSSESLYANNKLPCPKTKPASLLSRTFETDIGTSSVPISSITVPQDGGLDSFSVYNDSQVSINQPPGGQSTRPPLQVLPQDKSLTSFSVYEEASINQPSFKQSAPSTRPPLQVLPQDKSLTSFSVYEEASINQPSFKQSAPSTRPPLQVLPQDRSMGSFSVYEEASINQPSFKQSAPPTRPPLQVLPQDKSMGSFSVYEEASINQPSFKQSAPSTRPPLQVLPQEKSLTSFSVYEEASINQPSFKQSAPSTRPPLQVLPQDKSLTSFSVYEEASINQPSFKQSAPTRPPLQVLPQEKSVTSFSVYEEASINQPSFNQSAPPTRPPLQVLPQDKSVYDQASISHPTSQSQTASSNTMPMKVLNYAPSSSNVPLVTSDATSDCLTSIEKLSLSQKATVSSSLHSHNFPVPSSITNQEQPLPTTTNPTSYTHSLPVPFSISNPLPPPFDALPASQGVTPPPTNQEEAESISPEANIHPHPLVNETIDPSFFIPGYLSDDPTSTPCGGRRVGLAPFDVTAIQSYSPQSSNNNKPLPPPLPMPSLPPPPPPPPSQPLPQTDPARPLMQPYSFRGQHLDPIQEESRSYCSSSSGSTTTCSSKNLSTHSNASRSSNISQQSQHNEDEEPPEVQDLRSLGVMNLKRQVNPFTPETIQFMLQSLPITVTPVHRLPKSSPSMTTGHTVTLADGSSCSVIGKLAKGGFASVYNVKMTNGSTKALKIQNPPCLWEVAIIEELHKRLKANDLLKFSRCFMSVDAVHLYTNSSVIAYSYYPHGTLLLKQGTGWVVEKYNDSECSSLVSYVAHLDLKELPPVIANRVLRRQPMAIKYIRERVMKPKVPLNFDAAFIDSSQLQFSEEEQKYEEYTSMDEFIENIDIVDTKKTESTNKRKVKISIEGDKSSEEVTRPRFYTNSLPDLNDQEVNGSPSCASSYYSTRASSVEVTVAIVEPNTTHINGTADDSREEATSGVAGENGVITEELSIKAMQANSVAQEFPSYNQWSGNGGEVPIEKSPNDGHNLTTT